MEEPFDGGGVELRLHIGRLFSLRVATLTNQVEVNGGYHVRALTRVARPHSFVPKFVFGRSSKSLELREGI